ncbi:MAG: hypothetical protein JWM80_4638, partial [Cyanobacteria bacterium RYN_339]|nr:hypothetical protein [Cyanobacteria bacterium RYN_339]
RRMTVGLGVIEDADWVMARARWVGFDQAAIARVGADFAGRDVPIPAWNDRLHFTDFTPRTANYLLVLDGLNFSFWGEPRWGIDYRGKALRGYWALAAALKRAIEEDIPVYEAGWMAACTEVELAHVLRGRGQIPLFDERLAHLHELGERLLTRYGGEFANAIRTCDHSAVALTELLVRDFPSFDDASVYQGRRVRLLKRAQILPADIWGAFNHEGLGRFDDIGQLTAFADYKVPQVLERLGLLVYHPDLVQKLVDGVELPHGSEAEIELRAATIAGVERLKLAIAAHGRSLSAIEVDWILWEMGLTPAPTDKPYHLTRTTAY